MAELIAIIFIAFILDLLIGDPPYRYHPIRMIGRCIAYIEKKLFGRGWSEKGGGIILALILEALVFFSYIILITLFSSLHSWAGLIINLYLCYSCLALGDLLNHIRPVIHSLDSGNIDMAKKSMAMLVGREVQILDEKGLSRAAVETMAENFVDGFLSPLFWYLMGGVLSFIINTSTLTTGMTLMLMFKAASTLDSMVGYKNERYLNFGWAGAKLDDLMNFIPARLSIFILFLGAVLSRLHPLKGVKTAFKDRLKHDSPNAAHAESFVAGALGIRLGGPTRYPDGIKTKPWLGNGTSKVGVLHICLTTALIRYSAWIAVVTLLSPFLFFLSYPFSGSFMTDNK